MKIHSTITDFPLITSLDILFRRYKEVGVDAAEVMVGLKSRTLIKYIKKLSKKYDLPIASVHQPAWSFMGLYFDEEFVEYALELEVNKIVCHPLGFHAFSDKAMQKYFERLAQIREQKKIHIMLENMSDDVMYHKLQIASSANPVVTHMKKISEIADEYGFLLTYDVSHGEFTHPQNEKLFHEIFPKIGNIHLSSFHEHHHHLPLNMGDLDSEGFIKFLVEKKYKGLLTLEVYYPRWAVKTQESQFQAIADSVKIFRKITGKLS